MFNTLSHKGNANQNYIRFHLTPVRMATIKTNKNAGKGIEMGQGGNPYTPLVIIKTIEISMGAPQKTKTRTTI
jgi:hypothetical protein